MNTMDAMRLVKDSRSDGLNASDAAYLHIRGALVHGQFQPGSQLSERRLSDAYGVSRTPIREALRRLRVDGLVQTVGRHQIVTVLSTKEASDVYRARSTLEVLSATLATERMRGGHLAPVQFAELTKLADETDEAAQTGDARLASLQNLRFHKAIAEMGDNWVVIDALNRVWDRIAVASLSNLTDHVWNTEVRGHHQDIIEAIRAGDPDVAGEHMKNHIDRAALVYINHEGADDDAEFSH